MKITNEDHDVAVTMATYGGTFVKRLGNLFFVADADNQRRLKEAFPEYWKQYREKADLVIAKRERDQ
jgi:hypothetical protein